MAVPTQPATITGELDKPEYEMYNFQDQFVPVSLEEYNIGGAEPVYLERTFISSSPGMTLPGKLPPLIPPRATPHYPRVLSSQIDRPDPSMGHPMRDLNTLDPDLRHVRTTFVRHIWKMTTKVREPCKDDIDTLMDIYLQLPSPRVCYLTRVQLRRLILNIGRCHNYQTFVYEHYAAVIRDMQANGTVIRLSEWTGFIDAIAKGYYFDKKTRAHKASEALAEMIRSGIKPPDIIYISLVQAAVRAKDWNIVQVLDKEIRERGFDDHILVWTERFRIAGLLGDITQIHDLFREFSAKSMAVDIVFVNTVLAAFLGVDCPQVAELIYNRLRNHSLRKFGNSPFPRRLSRKVARDNRRIFLTGVQIDELERSIDRELRLRRIDEEQLYNPDGSPTPVHAAFSAWVENYLTPYSVRLIPNRETLRVFISYHCHYTGRMDDIAYYLHEFDIFGISLNYGIYTDLLHGFFLWHTSNADCPWNEARLRRLFEFVCAGIGKEEDGVRVTYALCLAAIRAFGKVCGGRDARNIWEFLRDFMKINDNVRHREEEARRWLKELMLKFESGEELREEIGGRDWRYKVGDWRMSYS